MTRTKHRHFIFVLCFFVPCLFFAMPPNNGGNRVRIHVAPVFGFYTINKNHAQYTSPKISASLGVKKEFRIDREYKTYLLVGVNYLFHGLNFRSYYFKPDSMKVYDKSFAYNYSLFIHEIDIPVQFKYLLRRENNSLFSPYVAIGYHLRYLLPGVLKVKQNDKLIRNDSPDLRFKNPLLYNKINAFVSAGIGWQRNSVSASDKGAFYVELNYRYGFSQYSFQTDYSANSLYINGSHLSFQLGLKF